MENKLAFVLMPFSESLSDVYDYLIKGSLEEAGYNVKRADDIKSQNNILEDIVRNIVESELIISDLTDSNPNVYYELGIAHALGKKVILITQEIDDLPFDLRSYRVISYGTHFSKMIKAKEELLEVAKDAIQGKILFGNPVKDFSPQIAKTEKTIQLTQPVMEEELGVLDYEIDIENNFTDLTQILELVSTKLSEELTPEITNTTEKISLKNISNKERRIYVQTLANHMEEYGKFLVPNNDRFRVLLRGIETDLEFLLSNGVNYNDPEAKENINKFIDALKEMEDGASLGRQGFTGMLEMQKSLPKIEKTFNRANRFMQSQVEDFIDNLELTISISSRARLLAKSYLNSKELTN